MLSAVRLPLDFDAERLEQDVRALPPGTWVPHFNTSYYEGDWSGVALRSVGGRPEQLYPDPTAEGRYADTENLAACPSLAAAVAAFLCPLQAVRLLRLGPGARVREHRDYRLGFDDGEVRIHVPITTNPDVEFVVDGASIVMAPGESWYVDFNLPHSVANAGAADRVHLVVDCVLNDWLRALIEDAAAR
ncbi:MAG: hypothetical protein QOH95_1584 [Gaiellaceae bacterium]|nr:hypothetical protein [Gaiellaceae bacterium]